MRRRRQGSADAEAGREAERARVRARAVERAERFAPLIAALADDPADRTEEQRGALLAAGAGLSVYDVAATADRVTLLAHIADWQALKFPWYPLSRDEVLGIAREALHPDGAVTPVEGGR